MNIGDVFNHAFLAPILNGLIFIFYLLEAAHIPGALGFSIMILTVAARLLVWPLYHSQIKSSQKMTLLKPLLDELKNKHKDNKIALQQAQMQLYKEHNINPAAGCLPALIQIPLFIGLYQSIINMFPTAGGGNLGFINSLLYFDLLHLKAVPDPIFFGLNLASKPSDAILSLLLLIPLFTAALTFVQSKMMMPVKVTHHPGESQKEEKEKEGIEDMMSAMQGQMLYLMPAMVGFFAFQFPVGLAIYWNTFTMLGITQQYKISGWGGISDFVRKIKAISS